MSATHLALVALTVLGFGLAACRMHRQGSEAKPASHPHPSAAHEDGPRGNGHGDAHGGAPAPGHRHAGGHHRFEDAEAWAKVFDDPARDAWQRPERVIEFLRPGPDDVVADLGAGTGYFTVRLARAVPNGRVVATDVEPDMVEYLRERARKEGLANVEAVLARPDDPSLPAGVDVVLLVDVYHHIADPAAYFAEVRRALSEGGRVVVVDFRPDAPDDAPGPPAAMRRSPEQVEASMAEAGFRRTRLDTTTLPYQYMIEFMPM